MPVHADASRTIHAAGTNRLCGPNHVDDTICRGLYEMVTRFGKTTRLLIFGRTADGAKNASHCA